MVRMDDQARAAAKAAIGGFVPDGGTAMGTWLRLATQVFAAVPGLAQKHAILLTDGINQHETPEQLTAAIEAKSSKVRTATRSAPRPGDRLGLVAAGAVDDHDHLVGPAHRREAVGQVLGLVPGQDQDRDRGRQACRAAFRTAPASGRAGK